MSHTSTYTDTCASDTDTRALARRPRAAGVRMNTCVQITRTASTTLDPYVKEYQLLMANPSNHGSAVIRLACDPKFFPNSDGSETVRVTGYAENDFANKAGEVTSEKLIFERYLPNGKRGAFGHMHTGDLVGFGYRLATSDYTNAQGERVYGQGNLAIINSVKLYSSKRESDTRTTEQKQQSAKQQESQAKQTEQQQENQAPQQRQQEAQPALQAQPQQQTSSQPQPNVQQQQPNVQQQNQAPQQPQMSQQGLQPVNPAIAQQIIAQQQHNPNAPININQIARDLGQQPPMPPQQAQQQQPPQVQQQPQQQQRQPQQQVPAGPIGYPDIFSPKAPAAQPVTPQQVQPQPQMQQQAPMQQQPQQPNLPPQIPQQAPQPQQQAPAQQPQQQQNQPGANELPYGMGGVQQNPSMAARQEYNSTYSETLNANRASSPKGGFSADHDDIPF